MAVFYFPLLFLVPRIDSDIVSQPYSLIPRKWDVSIFDLYSLAAEKHLMRVPVELMKVFLTHVNLEIRVDALDPIDAVRSIDTLRAMLYISDVAPTLAPFSTSHSLNAYAGINARTSGLTKGMHEGLREGITSKTTTIESWSNELSLMCLRGDPQLLENNLTRLGFIMATENAKCWQSIEAKNPRVRVLRHALAKAPIMPDLSSSILHMWQALEHLFNINNEITYRNSLLLAELCAPNHKKAITFANAKKSYQDRSRIAHGSASPVDTVQWMRAWNILRNVASAILRRKGLPSANDLTEQLLNG